MGLRGPILALRWSNVSGQAVPWGETFPSQLLCISSVFPNPQSQFHRGTSVGEVRTCGSVTNELLRPPTSSLSPLPSLSSPLLRSSSGRDVSCDGWRHISPCFASPSNLIESVPGSPPFRPGKYTVLQEGELADVARPATSINNHLQIFPLVFFFPPPPPPFFLLSLRTVVLNKHSSRHTMDYLSSYTSWEEFVPLLLEMWQEKISSVASLIQLLHFFCFPRGHVSPYFTQIKYFWTYIAYNSENESEKNNNCFTFILVFCYPPILSTPDSL